MWTDVLGNPVTLQDAASLAPLNDFVEGFIASEARAANILQAQQDGSAIVQAYCAALHMFAETRDAPANARPFLLRAQAAAPHASQRELRFVSAVAAWVDGDVPRAIADVLRFARAWRIWPAASSATTRPERSVPRAGGRRTHGITLIVSATR